MPIKRLKNANRYLRRGGIYELGLRLSARRLLPDRFFLMNETEIMEFSRLKAIAPGRNNGGYECACADKSAIEDLLVCSPPKTRSLLWESFKRFFEEHAKCYVVRQGASVVGYVWAFPRRYVLTYDDYRGRNLTVRSDDRSVFLGNGMIDEKYRLKGLFPLLMSFVLQQWPRDTHFYTAVDKVNERSMLSHQRLGFVSCGKVLCVTLLGVSFFFRKRPGDTRWTPQRPDRELVIPEGPALNVEHP